MQVPFVDLPRQIAPYAEELRPVIEEVIFKRADFIMRGDLLEFEKNFATYIGKKYAIGVANGSDALNLCVKVLGIGPGDEVITVSHTFIATIAAIVHAGATPVLVDVGNDHNINPDLIEKTITKKTRAIIPVHLNGRTCVMDKILEIAERYNLYVIEDNAQGVGSMFKGKKAGSFGIFSTNSFYPFKILGCYGDGGMICTDSEEYNYKLRCLRDNGQDRAKGEILFWGWNSRLDNLQAAILNVMLKHLQEIIKKRREIASKYCEGLKDIEDLVLPSPPSENTDHFDSFQNFVVTTPKRDEFVRFLNDNGVGTLISWPVPSHFHKGLKLSHFKLPFTEKLSREVVSLPMHPALTDEEVEYVIKTVRTFFKK